MTMMMMMNCCSSVIQYYSPCGRQHCWLNSRHQQKSTNLIQQSKGYITQLNQLNISFYYTCIAFPFFMINVMHVTKTVLDKLCSFSSWLMARLKKEDQNCVCNIQISIKHTGKISPSIAISMTVLVCISQLIVYFVILSVLCCCCLVTGAAWAVRLHMGRFHQYVVLWATHREPMCHHMDKCAQWLASWAAPQLHTALGRHMVRFFVCCPIEINYAK